MDKGLYKVLSKMGISLVASYRGAQLFEGVGLHEDVVELCLKGTVSRISGAHFDDFESDQKLLHKTAFNPLRPLSAGGCSSSCSARNSTPTTRTWCSSCKRR